MRSGRDSMGHPGNTVVHTSHLPRQNPSKKYLKEQLKKKQDEERNGKVSEAVSLIFFDFLRFSSIFFDFLRFSLILSAGPGRERPGIEISTGFN